MPSLFSHLANLSPSSTIVGPPCCGFRLSAEISPVSAAYNFTESGVGKYYVEANNVFQYVDPSTQKATELVAEVAEAHAASISGKLAVARPTVQKRATFTGNKHLVTVFQYSIADVCCRMLLKSAEQFELCCPRRADIRQERSRVSLHMFS